MKTCDNCGAQLEADDKFCTSCGTPVTESAEVKQPDVEEVKKDSTLAVEEAEAQEETKESVETDAEVEEIVDEEAEVQSAEIDEPETDEEVDQPKAKKSSVDTDAMNVKVEQTKVYAQNYWEWFKEAIKRPFEADENKNPFYGITTFVLFSVFASLFANIPGHQLFEAERLSKDSDISKLVENPFGLGMFVKLMLVCAIVYVCYVAVGYALTKFFSDKDTDLTLVSYANRFAHAVSYLLIFSVVAIVLMLIAVPNMSSSLDGDLAYSDAFKLVDYMVIFAGVGLSTGFISTFFDKKLHFKIDSIYVLLIAQIAMGIIIHYIGLYLVAPAFESYSSNSIGYFVEGVFNSLFKL